MRARFPRQARSCETLGDSRGVVRVAMATRGDVQTVAERIRSPELSGGGAAALAVAHGSSPGFGRSPERSPERRRLKRATDAAGENSLAD